MPLNGWGIFITRTFIAVPPRNPPAVLYLANTCQNPIIIKAEASKNPQPGIINCTSIPTPTKKHINPISRCFLNIRLTSEVFYWVLHISLYVQSGGFDTISKTALGRGRFFYKMFRGGQFSFTILL